MQRVRYILHHILAIGIALSVLLPVAISLAHSFENHDHFAQCDNPSDTHVHENKNDCDFHLINFVDDGTIFFAKAFSTTPPSFKQYIVTYNQPLYAQFIESRSSRGPPESFFLL